MLKTTLFRTTLVFGLALGLAATTTACNKQKEPDSVIDVQAGEMPEGGEWEGVYYNQVYGFLHLTESAGAVQGAWRTTAGDKWGELYGEVDGDVVNFSWTEYKVGVVGPNAKSQGHGYFRYTIPNPEEPHELKGEWGLGESNTGHSWDLLKQLNMDPDPKSVRPDELESRVGAEGFDGSKADASIRSDAEEAEDEAEEGAEEEGAAEGEEGSEE